MTAKPAKPERYVVDRIGTPDPETTEYFVLDIVNDWIAREILARLGNRYREKGLAGKAQECFDQLDATLVAHAAVMESRNPKTKGSKKKSNDRP